MSLSNVEFVSLATGFAPSGIHDIMSRNPKRYSTLIGNYRRATQTGKNVSRVRKILEKHLENDGQIVFVSPRNRNSEFVGNVLNLNEDGVYNLRILRYLLSHHNFLVSTAFALIGGYVNENSATSIICHSYRTNKEDFLNSISRKDSRIRLETFLKTQIARMSFDQKNLNEILEAIEIF